MVNKYPATCLICRTEIPVNGGLFVRTPQLRSGFVHLACHDAGGPAVHEIKVNGRTVGTQNAKGRCEDAPCCGCCS